MKKLPLLLARFASLSSLQLAILGTIALCLFRPADGYAVERQVLRQHVPEVTAGLAPVGVLDRSRRLRLAIGLPLRNQEGLDQLLKGLYSPSSPNFGKYLSPAQFAERFGPSGKDYEAIVEFAKAHGLNPTVRHPNRVLLDVEGDAGHIQEAFHVTLRTYRHPTEAREFYAPDVEPSLDLAVPVLHISGLDNYSLPQPQLKPRPAGLAAAPAAGSGPSGTYGGNDFRAAYVPGTALTGAGQSVGLLQFDGYYPSDIAAYTAQFKIPAVPLINVAVDGGVTTPGSNSDEVSLDIEMATSMAPGLSAIYVYEAPNPSPFVDLLNRMATDNLAKQLSSSWTSSSGANPSAETIFQQMAAQGQSYFNASGDSDAYPHSIPFPCDSPSITVVGGTTLTTNPNGSYLSETVWNWGDNQGSSGGISRTYSIPAWQQGVSMSANQGSTTKRNLPDVALTADNVYVAYGNGSSGNFGGTSCAAPLWAGFTALFNQEAAANARPSAGFLNPAIYTIGQSFNDITTGNNFNASSPSKFSAAAGYDLCTGWGTPGSAVLSALLGIGSAPAGLTYSTNPAAYTVGVAIGSNSPSNSGGAVVSYSVSPALPAGLALSATTGVITGTPAAITAAASYTVTATNASGSTTASLSIAVNAAAPATLTYATNPATYTKGSAIASNSPSNTGGAVASYSVSPALPAGLTLNPATGVLTGTPTAVTATASYTVTASNTAGFTTASLSITINDVAPSALTYATNPAAYTVGVAIGGNSPSNSGGAVVSYSVSPALPAGLALSATTGVISGTPMAITAAAGYTVTASNTGGFTTASLNIAVNDAAPSALTYATNPAAYTIGVAIPSDSPSNSGGAVASYSVSPALPAGLALNPATGVLTGTPAAVTAAAGYTVTAGNTGGFTTASLSIAINDAAPSALTYATNPAIYAAGAPIGDNVPSNTGGQAVSYSVAPALPAGLSLNPATGVISGTPAGPAPAASYTVTAGNTGGSTSAGLGITVVAPYALGTGALWEGPALGNDTVVLAAGPGAAAWASTANASWLHLNKGGSGGTGSSAIRFSFDSNGGPTRTGTLTIAGQTLTVIQAGSTYAAAGALTVVASSGLSNPHGVAVDGAGNVYIADSGNGTIEEWTPATGAVTAVAAGLNGPMGVAVDGSGNLYIADTSNNAIKKWTAPAGPVAALVSSGLNHPCGVAVDGSGNVYIADTGNSAIKEWSAASNSVITLAAAGLSSPTGVAVDAAGNVYIADQGNNLIEMWTAADNAVSTVAAVGSPNGAAVDGSGNIYIATAGNTISKWTAASGALSTLAAPGLNNPSGVAVDGSGNVYLADQGNIAVKELPRAFVDPTGKSEAGAAGSDSLPPILPATENLLGPFAPASDQAWLTIGAIGGGVVNFSFTANGSGSSRTANINVLGQQTAVTQPPLTPLQSWRQEYFGSTGNAGNAADDADPSASGIPNLLVFAFLGPNQNPAQAVASQLPQAQMSGGNLFFSFTQPPGAAGIAYGAEWSATLAPANWLPVTDTGSGGTHTFTVPIGNHPQIFLRLTVTDTESQ